MHFKVTSSRLIVGQFSELLESEGVPRSFSYIYPVNWVKQSDTPTHNFGLKSNQHPFQTAIQRILSFFEIQIRYFHVDIKTHSLWPMGRREISPTSGGEGEGEEILVRTGIFSLGGETFSKTKTFYKYWTSIEPKSAWPGVKIVWS